MSGLATASATPVRERTLAPFLAALAISKAGDAIYVLALPWIAYELTHSAVVMGTLYAVEIVPIIVFGALAGVWVDRYGVRRMMIAADVLRAVLVGAIPFLSDIRALYAIAFALGLLTLIFDVSTTAAIPRLVTGELTRANAAHQSTVQLAAMIGPALAGFLIQTVGARGALTIDALTFSATVVVVARQALFHTTAEPRPRALRSELAEGIRWLWRSGVVRTLALQAAIGNFGFAMVSGVMLFYLRDTLAVPPSVAGATFAMAGVGGVAGSLAIVPIARRVSRGALYPMILAVGFLGLLAMASVRSYAGAAIGLALVAACNMAWVILSTSVRQESIPTAVMGRVLAVSRVLSVAAMPVGAAFGGWIATRGAVTQVFWLAAITKLIELGISLRSEMRRL